ncbi:methyltransferase family protein [Actinomyces naeslundii]|uniref:methyltransferase family protein n=1 Tax=Actinomyces naeslundii TaxID=1655 RepID=UPI00096C54D1|nr:isoprenylcysteine carboxyl methyltransferase [Actinomyces naeslundii]
MAGLAQGVVTRGRRATPSSVAAATAVVGGSLCLLAGSAGTFLRHRTTVDPVRVERAQHLVVDGPNRLTRNPMYLGLTGLLLSHAIARRSPSALIPLAGFVWLIDRHQIPAEEKALEERFGQDYLDYKETVPRWLGTPWCTQGCCRSLCRR